MNYRYLHILYFAIILIGCKGNAKTLQANEDSNDTITENCTFNVLNNAVSEKINTTKTEEDGLIIYTPSYSNINLVCDTMPDKANSSVIFCAEAAFTGELLKEFKHTNIAGNHVSNGKRYRGYPCRRNTGCFVFYNGSYKFLYKDYSYELNNAAKNGGMGFGQETIIHKGKRLECKRKDSNKNEFRVLCELDNKLCIIDSKGIVEFGKFAQQLLDVGVTEALYLDMGAGWNYSWWRDAEGIAHDIHNRRIDYTTNWITFYK